MQKSIQIKTEDSFTLAGTQYWGETGSPGVLLLHMLPETKESWDAFAKKLQAEGFGVLAIDFRGHGESSEGPDGYRSFSEEETKQSIQDARAGFLFLQKEGCNPLFVIGASIGGNIALQLLGEIGGVRGGVVMSAGLNYSGVETLPAARHIREHQSVYFIAAKEDIRRNGISASVMAQELYEAVSCKEKKIDIFAGTEHGIHMFRAYPELEGSIVAWLKRHV
ncbi:MAG: hypothetical protein COU47_01760 [Candidatus Niyogibacteria bacterium CG10_big_fil_rev_8_21_14_0_10_46_36]|uniref:Serine aminopeptidase S33 domain-containing protein n=1 Tax=Candidatus Niyogibacteria bacterium CG10_big_fil_rev_8_21_14_0_10_46_36 TaxID=1974726 RepID=A0A2H0TFR0_9BACT|nr:MAG: hypothetical protein COU47_01760 [Candidatus Niyogibacteria bacterium CG10_big_fil_rev_8_21_14_0_10_46_36]